MRLESVLPGVVTARHYRRAWLRRDVLTGIVLAALLVPQGMAYAELAGLPPVTGLYATAIPLLVYALVGPSRILVVGPDSAVSPLVAATIIPLAAADPEARVALAGMLAILTGVLMATAGLARLGLVTELLSMPVRIGYLGGIAATVIVTQVPKLLGVEVGAEDLPHALWELAGVLGDTDAATAAVGVGALGGILVLRRLAPRVPGVLVAAVVSVAATVALDLAADGLAVVGAVPGGLPAPHLGALDLGDVSTLLPAAFGIALVAFADTSVLSKSYAARLRDDVDQNQELVALGVTNVAAGVFQGFPLSTSSSRTAVAEQSGARTQLAGVVAALALFVVLIAATGALADLPVATLAAIVIAAVLGLIDVPGLRRLWRWRRSEFWTAVAAFAGVAALGVLWGVGLAIGLSLLLVIRRAWRPHDAVLGRAHGVKGYHDIERYPDARQVPGLVLYRFDAPLFFANAEHFRDHVRELARDARWIVVAAEPITDVDATAAEVLIDLVEELTRDDVELAFAELKDPVRDRLERYGLTAQIGHQRFFPTIGVAVDAYLETTGVEWLDWEEAAPGAPWADGR